MMHDVGQSVLRGEEMVLQLKLKCLSGEVSSCDGRRDMGNGIAGTKNSEYGIMISGFGMLATPAYTAGTLGSMKMYRKRSICGAIGSPEILNLLEIWVVQQRGPCHLGYAPIHAGDAGSYRDPAWIQGRA